MRRLSPLSLQIQTPHTTYRAREGSHKRKAAGDQQAGGRDPKQPRAGTPAGGGAESSRGDTPARTPTPTPSQSSAPPGGGGGGGVEFPTDLMSLFRPGPGANLFEVLNNAQQVVEVLVKAQQHAAVEVRAKGVGCWVLVLSGVLCCVLV